MKVSITLFCLLFCIAGGLIFPQFASSTVYVDQSFCLYCHTHDSDRLHDKHDEEECNQCHNGTPAAGNVESGKCISCHEHDEGKCYLVDDHPRGAHCFSCHFECATPPTNHIDTCLGCHLVTDLHARLGHGECATCHSGTPQTGNVDVSSCTTCHPLGRPDKCNLANFHDPVMNADCLSCHPECVGVFTTTTTTILSFPHYTNTCEQCHTSTELHAGLGHDNCTECHNDVPRAGNVEPANCIVCHPLAGPGSCDLIEDHDPFYAAECLTCHLECGGGPTTTTTTQLFPHYTNTCEQCHTSTNLHAGVGHTNCAECHNGAPQAGNVEPASCIVCHPLAAPGSCNLIEGHDPGYAAECLICHLECGGGPSTTTTTQIFAHYTITCEHCHPVNALHAGTGHTNCAECHNGAPRAGNVEPANCIVCHPFAGPGSCDLIGDHDPFYAAECLTCHPECGGGPSTTTTTQVFAHYTITCEECHTSTNLHAGVGHSNCAECHNGAPQGGNVEPANCIVCHPLAGPGSCNLIEGHDPGYTAECLTCHLECQGGPSTTTTTQSFRHFAYNCDECHFPEDLHAGLGHTACAVCHNGPPQTGNTVEPANCMACHLLTDPGECPLTVFHAYNVAGTVCLGCHAHADCRITSTTTTIPSTTTTAPATTTTSLPTTTTTSPTTTTSSLPTTTTTTVSAGDSDDDTIPDDLDNCPETPNPGQEDFFPPGGNGIGDACECEGNFDCDGDCDGTDAATFKADFGRSGFNNPCQAGNPCNGDFDCDNDTDGTDAAVFKSDFGRSDFSTPCPICTVEEWCSY